MSSTEREANKWSCEAIAVVHSPYRQKFGIPRQAGLVPAARGWIEMLPAYSAPEMFSGVEAFSHIWLTFVFHAARGQGWRARVRPPRLGGNRRLGVFATRSPFRPNHLGLSAVELLSVERSVGVRLEVGGLDLLDGTPVLDIKPYLPYADAPSEARAGFADRPPRAALSVRFAAPAERSLAQRADARALRALLVQTLSLDPRPAYREDTDDGRVYGTRLMDLDVRWRHAGSHIEVLELVATR